MCIHVPVQIPVPQNLINIKPRCSNDNVFLINGNYNFLCRHSYCFVACKNSENVNINTDNYKIIVITNHYNIEQ